MSTLLIPSPSFSTTLIKDGEQRIKGSTHHQRVLMLDQGEKSLAAAKVASSFISTITLMIVSTFIGIVGVVILISRIKEREETNFCSVFVFDHLFVPSLRFSLLLC